MGDTRRFSLFAEQIAMKFAASSRVADVAGGKGLLQSALRKHGFSKVVSWDTRPKYANGNRARFYHYGRFDFRSAPRDYDLVVGMHPDEGTDHIIQYAIKHGVPFAVCPCCVMPSATRFLSNQYHHWIDHLIGIADDGRFKCEVVSLPMKGRNLIIVGRPENRSAPYRAIEEARM